MSATEIIDLNLDAGENQQALNDGSEAQLYDLVTSVNLACGGHTGDTETMCRALKLAHARNLKIGAHPSYPDRENFGRRTIRISRAELVSSIEQQMRRLIDLAKNEGVALYHVKAHGALYNDIAKDRELAAAFLEAVDSLDPNLKIMGLAESEFSRLCRDRNREFISEAFIDRAYETKTSLRSRGLGGAMIENVDDAVEQALSVAIRHQVRTFSGEKVEVQAQTLCIHGDSPKAFEFALAVRTALEKAGVKVN